MVSWLCISCGAVAADLNQEKAQLLVDINALGSSISALEQNTLPRVDVFLSLVPDVQYTPKSVTLLIDGKELVIHKYSRSEIRSLRVGALHALWQGDLADGSHQLQVSLTGLDRKDEPVQNTVKLDFDKAARHQTLEVKITSADEDGKQAAFSVKDWGDK